MREPVETDPELVRQHRGELVILANRNHVEWLRDGRVERSESDSGQSRIDRNVLVVNVPASDLIFVTDIPIHGGSERASVIVIGSYQLQNAHFNRGAINGWRRASRLSCT